VKFAPPASFFARSVASSRSRPTTQDLPSALYDGHIVKETKAKEKIYLHLDPVLRYARNTPDSDGPTRADGKHTSPGYSLAI
jgi:hypothetical protein